MSPSQWMNYLWFQKGNVLSSFLKPVRHPICEYTEYIYSVVYTGISIVWRGNMLSCLTRQTANPLKVTIITAGGARSHKHGETFLPINSTGKLKMVKGESRPLKFKHFLAPFKVFCSRPLQRAQSLETSEFSLITKRVSSGLKWSHIYIVITSAHTPHIISWPAYCHTVSNPCGLNYNPYIGN